MGKHVHRLSSVDAATRTATCAKCGPVSIDPVGNGSYCCTQGRRERDARPHRVARARMGQVATRARRVDKIREGHLLRKYGITVEQYLALAQQQGGRCACGKPMPSPTSKEKHFAVDHCHTTGRIRGILCSACNLALGMVADDPSTLRALAAYLEDDWVRAEAESDPDSGEAGDTSGTANPVDPGLDPAAQADAIAVLVRRMDAAELDAKNHRSLVDRYREHSDKRVRDLQDEAERSRSGLTQALWSALGMEPDGAESTLITTVRNLRLAMRGSAEPIAQMPGDEPCVCGTRWTCMANEHKDGPPA